MRLHKPNRRERRAQPIDQIVRANQIRRINAWGDKDAIDTDRQVDRIGYERTLKLDEQAKAKLTVTERSTGQIVVNARSGSAAALVAAAAIWNENTEIDEDKRGFLIPRKSLTSKLFLRLFDPVKEFADVPLRQLPSQTREKLAKIAKIIRSAHPDNRAPLALTLMKGIDLTLGPTVTNPGRLEWKSPTTLLRTNKPDTLETVALKRTTSRTKERTFETETDILPTWGADTPRTWDDEHPTDTADKTV